MSEVLRVDQILSNFGFCSRRHARVWVNEKRVTWNGAPVSSFAQKVPVVEARIDGEPVDHPAGILVMLNKPVGYVCSHDDGEGPRVYDLLPEQWMRRIPKVTAIGRLDKDTSGLLLITDQSALVHRLTSPKHHVKKTYRARVIQALNTSVVAEFAKGVQLKNEDKPCLPAELSLVDDFTADVTVMEGRYHQVRRMFAACGYTIDTLHRSHFAHTSLDALTEGQWRDLDLETFNQ